MPPASSGWGLAPAVSTTDLWTEPGALEPRISGGFLPTPSCWPGTRFGAQTKGSYKVQGEESHRGRRSVA